MDKIIEELRGLAAQSADGNITIHAPTLADRLETCYRETSVAVFDAGAAMVLRGLSHGVDAVIAEIKNVVKNVERTKEEMKNETR